MRNGASNNYKHTHRIHRENIQRYMQLHGPGVVERRRMLNYFINRADRGLSGERYWSWRGRKLCSRGGFEKPGICAARGGLRSRPQAAFFFFGTLAPFLRASERPMAMAC